MKPAYNYRADLAEAQLGCRVCASVFEDGDAVFRASGVTCCSRECAQALHPGPGNRGAPAQPRPPDRRPAEVPMKIRYEVDVIHVGGAFATREEIEEAVLEELQQGGDDIIVGDASYDIDDVSQVPDPEPLIKAAKAARRKLMALQRNRTVDPVPISKIVQQLDKALETVR